MLLLCCNAGSGGGHHVADNSSSSFGVEVIRSSTLECGRCCSDFAFFDDDRGSRDGDV